MAIQTCSTAQVLQDTQPEKDIKLNRLRMIPVVKPASVRPGDISSLWPPKQNGGASSLDQLIVVSEDESNFPDSAGSYMNDIMR